MRPSIEYDNPQLQLSNLQQCHIAHAIELYAPSQQLLIKSAVVDIQGASVEHETRVSFDYTMCAWFYYSIAQCTVTVDHGKTVALIQNGDNVSRLVLSEVLFPGITDKTTHTKFCHIPAPGFDSRLNDANK